MIPVGGEAWKQDSLCLTTLLAGWLCGPDELCTEYRERETHTQTHKQRVNRAKWHILNFY